MTKRKLPNGQIQVTKDGADLTVAETAALQAQDLYLKNAKNVKGERIYIFVKK